MQPAMGKEAFLAVEDRPLEWFPLPEDIYGEGTGFYLRTITSEEKSEIERRFVDEEATKNPGKFRFLILIRTVVDDLGQQIFDGNDRDALMGKSALVIEPLFDKACKLNGFSRKEAEVLEGNSESAPES